MQEIETPRDDPKNSTWGNTESNENSEVWGKKRDLGMKFPFIGMLVWDNRCQAVGTGQGKCHSHSYREILKE